MLLVFLLLGAALSLAVCLGAGYTGAAFAGFFLLFTLAGTLAVTLAYALFLLVLSLFMDPKKKETKNHPFYRFILIHTVGAILPLCGIRLRTEGLEQVPEGTFLLVGNHRSGFDPLIAIWALRKRCLNFIAKPSIFRIPIAGPFMRKTGFLSIDREDDRKALRTILEAADWMKRGEASFGVYPEGTRSHTDQLLPFRNGCFKAAQRAGVPIVVASTHHSGEISLRGPLRPTKVLFRICGVIDAATVSAKKTAELSECTRAMLVESLS